MTKKYLPKGRELLQLYQDHSVAQIAEMFNVQEKTVIQKIAEARNQKINLDPKHDERCHQIKTLLAEGKSFAQMAGILGLTRSSVVSFAKRNGLYNPPGELNFGRPIGCPNCLTVPKARGLCHNCYRRFLRRQKKNLVDYHREGLLIFDHPDYKIYYTTLKGYEIHTPLLNTTHISKPSPLEKLLLDHLHRDVLMELDRLTLQKEMEQANNNPI
jgi:transposase